MNRTLAIFFLSCWAYVCPAQHARLTGTVRDAATDSTLSFVNIMAYSLPDSLPVGFATSDDKGGFALEYEGGGRVVLKATCLGYQEEKANAEQGSRIDIRMHPDSKMLKTVVVNGRMPGIKVMGDTIEYNFGKYTDGSEKVLKDILAKLPGFNVDDKGQISVNGKPIKKVLVNGQDFFGEHNEQVVNNLPSDYVDKIQLRNNYSEYSMLSGFNTSKATALNVGIDSLHTGKVTGNAEAHAGFQDRYRTALNLYSFGQKAMWGVNAKLFNTGEEMMSLIDYVKLMGSVKDYVQSFGGAESIIDNGISTSDYIENDISTHKRNNAMLSANVAWNPNERVKINAYYIFNGVHSKGLYDISRQYADARDAEQLNQSDDSRQRFHHLGFNMKLMPAAGTAFDFRTRITAMTNDDNSTVEYWRNAWEDRTWNLSQDMSFVKNWNNKNLLTVSNRLAYNHYSRDVQIASDSLLYDASYGLYSAGQKRRSTTLDNFLSGSWNNRLSKMWQLKMAVSWNYIRSTLSAESEQALFAMAKQADDTNLYSYGVSLHKKRGQLRMDAGLDLAYTNRGGAGRKAALFPNVSLEWVPSSTNSVSLSYSSYYQKDNDYFARGTVINDYRRLTSYNSDMNLLHRKHRLSLSVNYFDLLYDLRFFMNAGCSMTEKPYIMSYESNAGRVLTTVMQARKNAYTQYAYLDLHKGFRAPLTLRCKLNLLNSQYQNVYNGNISSNRYSQANGNLSLATKMKTLFNIEVGNRYVFQHSKTGLTGTTLNLVSLETYVRPFLIRKEKFDVSMPLSFIYDKAASLTYRYIDCSFKVSFYAGAWMLFAESQNIFHTGRFNRISVNAENDYTETVTEHRMPGYIIAGAKMMF